LNEDAGTDTSRYVIKQWKYKWSENYGSLHNLPDYPDKEGEETVTVENIELSNGGHSVQLSLADHQTVDQMRAHFQLEATDGTPIEQTVYWTVKRIPK
jgi:hypothetical protein